MIYFCKGCSECGKACDDVCKELGKCCACITDPICKAMDRPLGGYVMLNLFVCLPAAVCAGVGLANQEVRDCDSPLMMFCAADAALGVIHFCFSLYIQQQIVKGFESAPLTAGTGSSEAPSAKELMNRAGHIVCYDVGFCLYVFVFVGSFGLNCVGLAWTTECGNGTAMPYVAASLLILFGFMAVSFIYCWYCLLSCDDCCSFFGQSPVAARRPEKKPPFLMRLFLGNSRSQQVRSNPAGAAPAAAVGKPGPAPAPKPGAAPGSGWSGGGSAPAAAPAAEPAKNDVGSQAAKFVGGGLQKVGKWIGGGK